MRAATVFLLFFIASALAQNDCGQHQTFSDCGDVCPRSCEDAVCSKNCREGGGCVCEAGYVRDVSWNCIKAEECPKCGVNEYFSCGSACDTTCENVGKACPIVNITCNRMCYCKPGYARDDHLVCIKLEECPVKMCNGDRNAHFAQCRDECARSCRPSRPNCNSSCYPGCDCNEGFVRGSNGTCVLPESCPV